MDKRESPPRNGLEAHAVKWHRDTIKDLRRMTDGEIAKSHSRVHASIGPHRLTTG